MAASFDYRNEKLPLFDRLGGRVFTALIAEKFCDGMASDPKLDEILRSVDIGELKKTVTDLASETLAGDTTRTLAVLEAVGAEIQVTQSHFNRCISHLIAAFVWAGINREVIEEVLDLVTPFSAQLSRREPTDPDHFV